MNFKRKRNLSGGNNGTGISKTTGPIEIKNVSR